jgi:hypothetical protein
MFFKKTRTFFDEYVDYFVFLQNLTKTKKY